MFVLLETFFDKNETLSSLSFLWDIDIETLYQPNKMPFDSFYLSVFGWGDQGDLTWTWA